MQRHRKTSLDTLNNSIMVDIMKRIRLFSVLIIANFAWCSMYGSIPSTPLAYYSPSSSLHMTRSGNGDPNDEPYTVIQTEAGRECVYIPASKFLYFRIDKTVVPSSMDTLIFKITYLDRGNGEMRMQYNATGNRNYESCVAGKTNTEEWITVTMAVTDASLRNAQNHGDIRINEGNYIARIEVYNGTLNPLSEPLCPHAGGSEYSEFIGKSVAGYQAWFRVAGRYEFWHHWGNDAVESDGTRWPRANNHTFEIYPDISIYEEADLAQTGFADLGNGESARLYNAASPSVIAKHFSLMQEHGIDGVAVQRFIGPEMRTIANNPAATLHSISRQAEQNNRLFYICYDITSTGLESTWADLIRFDWVYNIEQNYSLTQSSAYATVSGKPVVELWGTGFTDNHPGNAAETIALIEWLKSRGCYVIGGVPTYWRENRNDAKGPSQPNPANQESFEEVYKHYDMLSPWLVGRFSNYQEAQYFFRLQGQDKRYCDSLHIGYMPTVFPGFGWATWNTGVPNQAPRHAGEFLWEQAKNIRQTGCTNMYFSMFDEYDEGTALLSAATDYTMLPTDAYFLTTSADGRWLSPDFYLRLAGDATRMLKGKKDTAFTTPYSLGPVFYRNSFESRTTPYNYVNHIAQNTGTFPIDPCFYQPRTITGSNITGMKCEIVPSGARTGEYAMSVSGVAAGNSVWQYRFSKTNIKVTGPMRLTAYRASSGIGNTVQIMLSMRSGQTITTHVDSEDGEFSRLAAYIPQTFTGDYIDAISIYLNTTESGAFQATFDDILIEEWDKQNTAISIPETPSQDHPLRFDILGRPVSDGYNGITVTPSGKYLYNKARKGE